ncbi:TPA: hypothetical protein I7701_20085 [Vibrio vulnificus]|nr:hypothetical protein [Vibrio vulnificus]HAS8286375.1 hypothetical protein [Vibrio vulnificus]HAS8389060.1 hypothetical protein [Vibrio vulnificus]
MINKDFSIEKLFDAHKFRIIITPPPLEKLTRLEKNRLFFIWNLIESYSRITSNILYAINDKAKKLSSVKKMTKKNKGDIKILIKYPLDTEVLL